MSPAPLPPHAPLTAYYRDEDDRHRFLRRIFDETAPDYDRIESVLALGSGRWYRRKALERAGLAPGDRVLASPGIGAYAELITLAGAQLARMPANMDFAGAAVFLLTEEVEAAREREVRVEHGPTRCPFCHESVAPA